jgi:hypothetical protein
MQEKLTISRSNKTVVIDLNKNRHNVSYTIDDTDGNNKKLLSLTDQVQSLAACDVATDYKGTVEYDGSTYSVKNFIVEDGFQGIIDDIKQIAAHLTVGTVLTESDGYSKEA